MANEKILTAIAVGYGAALYCGVSAVRRSWLMARARSWPSTTGKILEAAYSVGEENEDTYYCIRYNFTVGDQRIEGYTPRLSGSFFWSKDEQADFTYQWVMGDQVEVFYDPRNPRRNCLDRDDPGGIFMLWFIAVAGLIAGSAIAWWNYFRY